jgi:hypothetical protein
MGDFATSIGVCGYERNNVTGNEKARRSFLLSHFQPSDTIIRPGNKGSERTVLDVPASHTVWNASSLDQNTWGSTRQEFDRKKLDSQIPDFIDGLGESPYPFFQPKPGPRQTQYNTAERTIIRKTSDYLPNLCHTVSNRVSPQYSSKAGKATINNRAKQPHLGKDNHKSGNHSSPDHEQFGGAFPARQKIRDKYDLFTRPPPVTFSNDLWYSSEDPSVQYGTEAGYRDPRSVEEKCYASIEKLATADNTCKTYPRHCSKDYNHMATATKGRGKANNTYQFGGNSAERHTPPNQQTYSTDNDIPGRLDRESDNWLTTPTPAQRYPRPNWADDTDGETKDLANTPGIPYRRIPTNMVHKRNREVLRKQGTPVQRITPAGAYQLNVHETIFPNGPVTSVFESVKHGLPVKPGIKPSTLSSSSGVTYCGKDKSTNEPIREDILTSLPSQNDGAVITISNVRRSGLSVSLGPGPDIGTSTRTLLDTQAGYGDLPQPITPADTSSSSGFDYASEIGFDQQNVLNSPTEWISCFPPFQATGSSKNSSSYTIGTQINNDGMWEPLVNKLHIGVRPATSIASPPTTHHRFPGAIVEEIDMSMCSRLLIKFSMTGVHCEKLCAKITEFRQMDNTKSFLEKLTSKASCKVAASGICANIREINKLANECIQEIISEERPFTQFVEEAPKGAFKTVCESHRGHKHNLC